MPDDMYEALLVESTQWTGGKQRLTATRRHQLVRAEGHAVGVTLVKEAVAEWKRQRREVMIPLTYRPGELAEVDFFEVLIDLNAAPNDLWATDFKGQFRTGDRIYCYPLTVTDQPTRS